MSAPTVLGTGPGFPFQPSEGRLGYVSGSEKVRQSIVMILLTRPRERIMRPDFGCGLHRFLMRPNDVATRALIRREVEQALSRWEPRIEQVEVEVAPGPQPEVVHIRISYRHRRDGSPDSLVVPFSLELP